MIIAVFSLGQFISSKLDVLKTGFQAWFLSQGKEISGDTVWQWMVGNLAPLRVGDITLEQFCEQFNQHFQVAIAFDEFSGIFNSMSKLDEQSLKRIGNFKGFLDHNEHIRFLLVSHTNFSHLNYIMEQIEVVLPDCRSGVINNEETWSQESKFLFAPSMFSKCVEHRDTLQYALDKLQLSSDDIVISFVNTIKTFEHPGFSYAAPGANLEEVADILEQVHVPASSYKL